MSSGWPCPQCGAMCRNVVTLQIHRKHCRALSVEEIFNLIDGELDPPNGTRDRFQRGRAARVVYEAQIARLRGRKGV